MQRYFAFFLLLLITQTAFPNAAQPGFWNAGGTGTFSLLYPEDSAAYQQIQMVKELVSVQLYRGFAVVKGSYWMYNETADTVQIRVGYPLNASYEGQNTTSYLEEVRFDSLYGLRARVNQQSATIISTPIPDKDYAYENNNWYVWTTDFPPGDTTYIEVYFVVNTNNTKITKGYDREYHNGFIYLLETGATWKQPIVTGEVRIQLMEDLTPQEIYGIAPGSLFGLSGDGKIIRTQFEALSPTGDDNIVLAYGARLEHFEFSEALSREGELYAGIDAFAAMDLTGRAFVPMDFGDPFEVSGTGGYIVGFIMVLGFLLPFLAIFAVILIGYMLLLKWRKRKAQNGSGV